MIAPIPLVAPSRGSGAVWDGTNVGADRGMDYCQEPRNTAPYRTSSLDTEMKVHKIMGNLIRRRHSKLLDRSVGELGRQGRLPQARTCG
jgi:hypothetical protein